MRNVAPWKILHLNLSEGISLLAAELNCQGFYLVFWWHDIPLGYQAIPATRLPMSAAQLTDLVTQTITPAVSNQLFPQGHQAESAQPASLDIPSLVALENPLEKLWASWANSGSETVEETISVVICTRDRPEQLVKCLQSLQNLSYSPQEIVIVDNAPITDKTYQLVCDMPGVRYVKEPRPGLSVARNTGIRHSTGDIIAFTDDDVIVHPNWLVRIQQSFQQPEVMAVTGLVLPAELETEAQIIFEMGLGCLSGEYRTQIFDQAFFQATKHAGVPVWRIGAGANMAFRRRAFELVGGFDERLGAGASGCSEDSELWYRILAEDWLCRYEPTAVVFHHHRQDLNGLNRQMYYYMRGHVAALLIQFARYRHWGNLFRLIFSLPTHYTRLLLSSLLRGLNLQHRTYLAEVSGCLAGIKFYFQHRNSGAGLQNYT